MYGKWYISLALYFLLQQFSNVLRLNLSGLQSHWIVDTSLPSLLLKTSTWNPGMLSQLILDKLNVHYVLKSLRNSIMQSICSSKLAAEMSNIIKCSRSFSTIETFGTNNSSVSKQSIWSFFKLRTAYLWTKEDKDKVVLNSHVALF